MSQRILEAVGAVAGSSLEQTSWLSRNLEVKAQPQVCPQGDEDDHDGNEFEGKPMQKCLCLQHNAHFCIANMICDSCWQNESQ